MSEEVNWKELAEGFRLERNIMQEMAMKAKAEVERWKKKAELHAFEIQKRIVNAHGQGYEAGRREGLYVASDLLRNNGVLLPIIVGETEQDRIVRFALAMADKIEALIDSPKAEGEETK